ncbi:MAG: SUMF1/EgtB/PvdO family nonheme iron enzyme [Bacteroidota bacterium]
MFTWGNNPQLLDAKANTWQGTFPTVNEPLDGFEYIAPVKSYEPNSIGLYDMSGNVWEITSDFFNTNYYKTLKSKKVIVNPKGASTTYTPSNPYAIEHIIKGGSVLCNALYCASYRISAKMGISPDSASDHTGFRTVTSID